MTTTEVTNATKVASIVRHKYAATKDDFKFLMSLTKKNSCTCDFCEVALEEEELFEIGGYKLCMDCKSEYLITEAQ